MANTIRKIFAMILAVTLCVGMAPSALAAVITETEEEVDGGMTTVITTTTETTEDGNTTTVTVTVKTEKDGVDDDGAIVDYDETKVTTTKTTESDVDTVVTEKVVTDGTETKDYKDLDVEIGDKVPTGAVTAKPGEKQSEDFHGEFTETEGDTTTTNIVDRTVEVSVEEEDISIESDISMEAVGPDNYDGKEDLISNITDPDEFHIQETEGQDHEGYDYQYIGFSEYGDGSVSAVKVVYKRDENGQILKDADGNPVIEHFLNGYGNVVKTSDGEVVTDVETLKTISVSPALSVVQFLLQTGNEEEFKSLYAYCCDIETDPKNNAWYTVANLEDSDYYPSEESEAHIRGIVTNGYWGVSNEPDENGNYKTGSVALIREKMKQAIQNGDIENILIETKVSENGEEVKIYLSDVIDELTEGEAMQATQAAIWSYSNGSTSVQSPKDGYIILDPANSESGADAARINALYGWLMQQTTEKKTTVINEQNFIEEVSLAVGSKVDEVTVLNEDNTTATNGVYETNLNFTLAFVPTANDDLLVCLKYIDLDGNEQTVTKRLAGNAADYEKLGMNEDGSYTFTGLKLSENQDFNFNLNLTGTQYLEQGVYIYTAQGGVNTSQTFVGLAEGTQEVNVNASMSLSFSVEEKKDVHIERVWHEDNDPTIYILKDKDTEEIEEEEIPLDPVPYNLQPTPPAEKLDVPSETETILDEDVPLAAVPGLGDESYSWLMIAAFAGIGFVALNLPEKKREEN